MGSWGNRSLGKKSTARFPFRNHRGSVGGAAPPWLCRCRREAAVLAHVPICLDHIHHHAGVATRPHHILPVLGVTSRCMGTSAVHTGSTLQPSQWEEHTRISFQTHFPMGGRLILRANLFLSSGCQHDSFLETAIPRAQQCCPYNLAMAVPTTQHGAAGASF